jgi:hypothetical protein
MGVTAWVGAVVGAEVALLPEAVAVGASVVGARVAPLTVGELVATAVVGAAVGVVKQAASETPEIHNRASVLFRTHDTLTSLSA